MRLDFGDKAVCVDIVHAEEQRRRLDTSGLRISEYTRSTRAERDCSVSGCIDDHLRLGCLQAGRCQQDGAAYGVTLHHRMGENAVVQDFHTGFLAHVVIYHLEEFGIERGDMVMSFADPGREFGLLPDTARMEGSSYGHEPVHYFLEKPPDDHFLALGVIAGHERTHEALGTHASQAVAGIDQHDFRSQAGCGNGCAHSGRASADDQDIASVGLFHRSLRSGEERITASTA